MSDATAPPNPRSGRDLASKLRAIVRNNPPEPARELIVEPDVAEKRGVLPPPPEFDRVAEALGGRRHENKYGAVLTVDRRYESDRWHGSEQIGGCEMDDFEPLRTMDARFRSSWPALDCVSREPGAERPPLGAPRSPLFFDLETTGLSGGAGTVAFLVGCAWFDCGALQVRQFVLTSMAAERALLEALREQIDAAPFVASYNGRTFDAPLMDVRWAFHRLPSPFETKPHFDMLPPARRLWKHRGEQRGGALERFGGDGSLRQVDTRSGCSLMAFERQLLGFRRVDDVPGFEIPSRYFQFLRTGNASPLESVLEHNRLDLVSLAVLTARAARIVRGGHEACADARESLALGRLYEQTGRLFDARACYGRAADAGDRPTRADALSRLAVSLRREKRYDEAAAIWRRILDGLPKNKPGSMLPLERLAMEALAVHHEHREKDLELAKKFAAALNDENGDEGIRRRLSRLERKMSHGPLLN
ncbi:MAG: ribonuclease H-like domain-containing protein [Acidobacteriota bacterium]|nr:ribonuclease H-like domain-containing protein [Acidobacteriota bacterium]